MVPAGTYRLSGRVLEADVVAGIPGARIEVTAGTGTGLRTASNDEGRYSLHGVSGDVEVTVTKNGYALQVLRFAVTEHLVRDARLPLLAPRPAVGGIHELRVTVDPSCGDSWPDSLRTRRYVATLEQSTNRVMVALSGARFAQDWTSPGGRFEGMVEPPGLVFHLFTEFAPYYREYPDVTEVLDGNAGWLTVGGTAVLTGQPNGFGGTLDGLFLLHAGDPFGGARELASCVGRHQFVLTRTTN